MSGVLVGFAGMTHLGVNSAAAALAHGFRVVGYDADAGVIEGLRRAEPPVLEPGLPEMLRLHASRANYTADVAELLHCDLVYIVADVPTDDAGKSDLASIRRLIEAVSGALARSAILVVLCQVPPGFTRDLPLPSERLFYQVETLVFGQAVERARHPERIILGCADPSAALPAALAEFLSAFACPILPMRYESAELAKIAINCCLVSSISVANTLAELCERLGAEWSEIVPALKLDRRIGQHAYLAPGLGLAGGNLERDLATVLKIAGETGAEAGLISSFVRNSRHRRDWVLRVLHTEVLPSSSDATIGILGLAYKENTASTKNSPALALIECLSNWKIQAYDPLVAGSSVSHPRFVSGARPEDAVKRADALAVMTPWPQFRSLDLEAVASAMRGRVVIDPYRTLEPGKVVGAGLDYFTLGARPLRGKRRSDT